MNRWISNLVLGIFALVLVTAYGVAKQPPVYSLAGILNSNQKPKTDLSAQSEVNQKMSDQTVVTLPSGTEIKVDVVTTAEDQARGLSSREELARDAGMFFVFDVEGRHSIWMKDMLFPIDIIWLDSDGVILDIEENAPAPAVGQTSLPIYESQRPSRYVLEVSAGLAAEEELAAGQTLTWSGEIKN